MIILGSVHIKFKFLCVSGTLGMEVTDTPGLEIDGTCFCSNGKFSVSKTNLRLSCHIVKLFFSLFFFRLETLFCPNNFGLYFIGLLT